jgi:hypothetical protein
MYKRLVAAASVALVVLAIAVGPALADGQTDNPPVLLDDASQLQPMHPGRLAPPVYGYLPLHARDYARAKAAANSAAGLEVSSNAAGGNEHGRGGGGGGPTVTTPTNVSPSFNGTYDSGITPPDTTGAIGPTRYMETINSKYAIYDRNGTLTNGGSLSALAPSGFPTGLFGYTLSDPQVMWDGATHRFYYVMAYFDLSLSDNGLIVGFSKTDTPGGSADFCKYIKAFNNSDPSRGDAAGVLPDYPKLGDSQDLLLFGFNAFSNSADTYDGSRIWWLSKPATGSSCPSGSDFAAGFSPTLLNADGSLAATPVPAHLVDDANGAGYAVANADLTVEPGFTNGANFATLFTISTAGSLNGHPTGSVSGPKNVSLSSYKIAPNAPEKGSTSLLDTLDGRFEAAVAAIDPGHAGKMALWTAHAVKSTDNLRSEERWYEIDVNAAANAAPLQAGAAASGSLFVWNGAISPDRNGSSSFGDSMAMSVNTSSSSTYPAIAAVWKKGGVIGPAGTQSPLTALVTATGPNVDFSCSSSKPCRWGDYSGATPDPAATGTVGKVWLANQYNNASSDSSGTDWRTRVFAITPTV